MGGEALFSSGDFDQ